MATSFTGRPAATVVHPLPLVAGVVAGPLFIAVSLVQIPFRDGFDMTRHAFSFLLIGPGGWLQIINFILVGLLFTVAGVGLRRRLTGRTGRTAQVLATTLGAGLILAGMFPPPPSFGYPIGAPAGAPAQLTTTALLHAAGFIIGVLSFTILQFVLASWLWRKHQCRWAAIAAVTGLALLTVPPTSGLPFGTTWLYAAVGTAFHITSIQLQRLRT